MLEKEAREAREDMEAVIIRVPVGRAVGATLDVLLSQLNMPTLIVAQVTIALMQSMATGKALTKCTQTQEAEAGKYPSTALFKDTSPVILS